MAISLSSLIFAATSVVALVILIVFNLGDSAVQKPRAQLECSPDKLHIVVTGGAGFIGSHAVKLLLNQGHCVTAVDNFSRGNPGAISKLSELAPSRFRFARVDLGSPDQVRAVFRSSTPKVDVVMHFAAVAYVGESVKEPTRYYQNITTNTVILLDAMYDNGVTQLVYSSTCAVYGSPETLPVTEDTPVAPVSPYGRSKAYAEQAIRDFAVAHPDFKSVLLRYFNVYGSDPEGLLGEWPREELRRQHARISNACLDAAMGQLPEVTIMGMTHPTPDGTTIRDYIHVQDLVGAHLFAKDHMSNPPDVFNIGTGKGTSSKEFVQACIKATGTNFKVKERREARAGDSAAIYANAGKIQRVMGWTANYTNVEEGLGHAWRWRQLNPNGYD